MNKQRDITRKMNSYIKLAKLLKKAIKTGEPAFEISYGSRKTYLERFAAMGVTLVTQSQAEEQGYRLKKNAKPVAKGWYGDLYILECHFVIKAFEPAA